MNVSCNWLKKYVELPASTDHLKQLLTESGLEIEAVENPGGKFTNVVVGEVLTCEKHPNADKLSKCTVSDGAEVFPVVCGAPNVAAGQKVAFARPGAYLSEAGFTIEKRKIRGEVSEGMICAPDELGLPGGHDGIIVYPADAPVGTSLQEYLKLDDIIFQIGITPNRGDALSHIGVARDIAALTGKNLVYPEIAMREAGDAPIAIHIETPELCPRYSGAVIEGITVKPSPEWMQRALEAVGVRPINCIVDVTNYVMMEFGQPMHAFDADKLAGGRIVVRASEQGEPFTTLDDKQHKLEAGSILICDAEKPVALGGVMGGANSEITDETVNILLESAYFNPSAIRKTAKRLGINSESSYRFERHVDPNGTVRALNRAVDLILELAGGEYKGAADAYPKPYIMPPVTLRYQRISQILGIDVPKADVLRILEALEFSVEDKGESAICVSHSCRTEMDREIDIIEEIARIYGYDKIPTPESITIHVGNRNAADEFMDNLRTYALGLGFDEILTASIIRNEHADPFAPGKVVTVKNPVNAERQAMRTSIIPCLLETIALNINNGVRDLAIFEMGAVFRLAEQGEQTIVERYNETDTIGFALTGNADGRGWNTRERKFDLFDLKGRVEALLRKLHIGNYSFLSSDKSSTLSGNGLELRINGEGAGELVEISKQMLKAFDLEQPVFIAELKLEALRNAAVPVARFKPIPKYPVVYRDLAFVVPKTVSANDLVDTIAGAKSGYMLDARIIDVYTSDTLGAEKKSMAVTMTFQSPEKTLTEKEIEQELQAITRIVESSLHATLRAL